jgi:conjugal transfer/entry exclusion protein
MDNSKMGLLSILIERAKQIKIKIDEIDDSLYKQMIELYNSDTIDKYSEPSKAKEVNANESGKIVDLIKVLDDVDGRLNSIEITLNRLKELF